MLDKDNSTLELVMPVPVNAMNPFLRIMKKIAQTSTSRWEANCPRDCRQRGFWSCLKEKLLLERKGKVFNTASPVVIIHEYPKGKTKIVTSYKPGSKSKAPPTEGVSKKRNWVFQALVESKI